MTDENTGDNTANYVDDKRNAIYAKREEQINDDIEYVEGLPTDDAAPSADAAPLDTQNDAPATAQDTGADTSATAAATAQEEKHKLIINGQQAEYTTEELKRLASMGIGAHQKFEEAARMRKEAQELMFSRQDSQPTVNTKPQPEKNQHTPTEELKDILYRLDYGTEEERIEALMKAGEIFSKQRGIHGPAPEELVNIAATQALTVIQARHEQEILMKEFSDILADPPIAQATDVIARQLAEKYNSLGKTPQRLELLREAGTIARERYLKPVQTSSSAPQPSSVIPMNEKLERKRAAPQPPTAANAVAQAAPKQDSVSPSSVIAAMRKARGQA
jgi:hypothetical protein